MAHSRPLWLFVPLMLLLVSAPAAATSDGAEGPSDGQTAWTHRDKLFDVTLQGDQAWIVGYPGVILHSPDRGQTWQAQEGGLGEALYAVDFVDERRGWIVGRRGLILHTNDGGATWTPQVSGTREPLLAVDFVDERRGWAVGNFAAILHTSDGGETWQPQTLGPDDDTVLNGVSFADAKRGWLAGEFGTIAHTVDGGATWERQDTGVERTLFDVSFRDGRSGIAVGTKGTVVVTEDGGGSWKQLDPPTKATLLNVHHGPDGTLACGRGGMVVFPAPKTGELTNRRAETYVWLAAIAGGPNGLGIAVGRAGTIIRTTDGGQTWTVLPPRR